MKWNDYDFTSDFGELLYNPKQNKNWQFLTMNRSNLDYNKLLHLQVDEKFQMFFDCQSVKKYIMLWTESQALSDSFHIC